MNRVCTLTAYLAAVISLRSADLRLTNGREFKNYRIMSETATTVTVFYEDGAAKVEKSLLPPDVRSAHPIDEKAAAAEAEANAKGRVTVAGKTNAAKKDGRPAGAHGLLVDGSRASEKAITQKVLDKKRAEYAAEAAWDAEHPEIGVKELVRKRAEQYYKSQYRAGSGATYKFDIETEINEPRPVPGWPGRYEVTGVAWFQYFDAKGGGTFAGERQHFIADVQGTTITSFKQRLTLPESDR
jgi:hypothetical protein